MEGTDDCDENATCRDTDGSFTCTCNEGYMGDGQTCEGMLDHAHIYRMIPLDLT